MLVNYRGNPIEAPSAADGYFEKTYPNYTNLWDGSYTEHLELYNSYTQPSTNAFATDYIDISGNEGKYLYIERVKPNDFTANPEKIPNNTYLDYNAVQFWDSDKGFISWVQGTGSPFDAGNRQPIEIPVGAHYVRISWYYSYIGGHNVFVGIADDNSQAVLPYEEYYAPGTPKTAYLKHENLTYTDAPIHRGKTWVKFGDSLTDSYGGHDWQESTSPVGGDGWKDTAERVPWTGYFWASKIAREMGLTMDNRAKSGSNINVGSNGNYTDVCGVNILNAFIAEIDAGAEPPDYITIGFGSNAIVSQLGTAEDTAETTTTVCGAVKYFIKTLREKCPNAAIGFVLPPQSDWGDTSTVKSVEQGRAAIKSVLDLDEYAVPYVDMWKESGITVDMLPDGIHVSSKQANNLYYHAMRRFMMGL